MIYKTLMSDIQYSHEVNLRPAKAARDIYKYTRIYSNLNTGNVSLSANSNPELTFEIPVKAMNLSKSYISFQMDAIAPDASAHGFNLKGASMIQRATLQTRSGLVLADLSYADVYTGSVPLATTPVEKIPLSGSSISDTALTSLTYPESVMKPLMVNYSTDVTTVPDNVFSQSEVIINQDVQTIDTFMTLTNAVAVHHANLGGANVAQRIMYHIPLSCFVHTILAVDKTLLLPEVLTLRIVFNDWTRFTITEATADIPAAAPTWTSIDIVGCILNLAISKDPIVVSQLSQGLQSGIQMTIPYVHSNLQGLSTTSQSINLRYNISYGQRLLNVYNVVMPGAYSRIRYWSSSNLFNSMVSDYYTTLDTVRLQDSNLRSLHNEDYTEHRDLLEGSILESPMNYKANRITVDSFRAGRCIDWPMADTVDDGIPLTSNELTYSIFNTVDSTVGAGARVTYTFAVVQKQLSISNQAISFM